MGLVLKSRDVNLTYLSYSHWFTALFKPFNSWFNFFQVGEGYFHWLDFRFPWVNPSKKLSFNISSFLFWKVWIGLFGSHLTGFPTFRLNRKLGIFRVITKFHHHLPIPNLPLTSHRLWFVVVFSKVSKDFAIV